MTNPSSLVRVPYPSRIELLRAAAVALLCIAGVEASAHQTYLISDVSVMQPGTLNFLTLRNGTYHESANSITHQMTRDISVIQRGKRASPSAEEMFDADDTPSYKASHIKISANQAGTALAGVATEAKVIGFPSEMYADYLQREGLVDAIEAFKGNRLSTVRERYTKQAKAIFQIGDALSNDYSHKLGYRAEIFLERNPGELKPGDDAGFRVLLDDRPLVNQVVYVGQASKKAPASAGGAAAAVYTIRTDRDGKGAFKITAKDKWAIQFIHMRKASDAEADYESNYSTLTFEVR